MYIFLFGNGTDKPLRVSALTSELNGSLLLGSSAALWSHQAFRGASFLLALRQCWTIYTAALAFFCTFNPGHCAVFLSCVIPFVFLSCSYGSVASIARFLLQQCLLLPDPKWRSAVLNRGTASAVNVKRMYKFTSGVIVSDRTNWIDCPVADTATSTLYPMFLVSSGAMPVYTVQKMEASLMQYSQVLGLLKWMWVHAHQLTQWRSTTDPVAYSRYGWHNRNCS